MLSWCFELRGRQHARGQSGRLFCVSGLTHLPLCRSHSSIRARQGIPTLSILLLDNCWRALKGVELKRYAQSGLVVSVDVISRPTPYVKHVSCFGLVLEEHRSRSSLPTLWLACLQPSTLGPPQHLWWSIFLRRLDLAFAWTFELT